MISLKDFFSFKRNLFFWLNILAMIAVVIIAAWSTLHWMDRYTHHGKSYVVPDVKEKPVSTAKELLQKEKMKALVIDSTFVKGMPAGIVLDQTPAGGSRVKEGRTIYLTINTLEIPKIKLPDLADNSSVRQAAAKLKSMGFRLTEPELIPGEQDWVYGIKYKGKNIHAGDAIPYEALLTLCVGSTKMRDSLNIDTLSNTPVPRNPEEDEPEIDESWF